MYSTYDHFPSGLVTLAGRPEKRHGVSVPDKSLRSLTVAQGERV